jgi:hypothetical protein
MSAAKHTRRPDVGARRFVASYVDNERLEEAARKEGWNPEEHSSALDFVEAYDYEAWRAFATKDEAVAFVRDAVNAGKTAFGVGDVFEQEYGYDEFDDEHPDWQRVAAWYVDGDTVEDA